MGNHRANKAPDLAEVRRAAVLTQVELAAKSRIAAVTIIGLEGGRHAARPSTIRKLAEALGQSPQDVQAACAESIRRAEAKQVAEATLPDAGDAEGEDAARAAADEVSDGR